MGSKGITVPPAHKDLCPSCGREIAFHVSRCNFCFGDVGFPNVRKARSQAELDALDARYQEAKSDAEQRGVTVFETFENEVAERSRAVICRSFNDLATWLKPGAVYQSFHNLVASGARTAQDNEYDRVRKAVDELLFPQYCEDIVFGALTLDGHGIPYYGEFSVVVRTDALANRATVFEENSLGFMRSHDVKVGAELPAGYRADWAARGKLAVTKVALRLTPETLPENFPGILLSPADAAAATPDGDFVEVHVFGGISNTAIDKILVNGSAFPLLPELKAVLGDLVRKANDAGAAIELC